MDDVDKYDKTYADKLLTNINTLGDLTKLMVPDPSSDEIRTISLRKWVAWLIKRVEDYGNFGIEDNFLQIIKIIDNNMMIMTDRMKEGFRRLISIIERQEKEIEEIKEREAEKEQIQQIVPNEISYEHSYEVGEKYDGKTSPNGENKENQNDQGNEESESNNEGKEDTTKGTQKPQNSNVKPEHKRGFGRI